MRKSRQGTKKSPPTAGRGRGSRKPKPHRVVPITKYFSRSPKSTPLVAEAAGTSSHSNAQLSPPLKELPKPPLSDSSNQSFNGYTESTSGEKTSTQPLKVSSKKIKLGDVRVVLRKSPVKRENKVIACSEAGAEDHQHKPQTETPRSNVITISDSPAELSSSLSIDVELTAPEPKRSCLIDLTESPLVMEQRSSVKAGSDTNERMKEPVQATNSTTQNTNCTIRTALFTDCEMQCTSMTPKDDLASITSPSPSSQKNDKVEGTSSSPKTAHDLQAGEKAIQHTEDGTSQLLREEPTRSVHHPTGEGGIQPQTLNPLDLCVALKETSTQPDSSSATVSNEINRF